MSVLKAYKGIVIAVCTIRRDIFRLAHAAGMSDIDADIARHKRYQVVMENAGLPQEEMARIMADALHGTGVKAERV